METEREKGSREDERGKGWERKKEVWVEVEVIQGDGLNRDCCW